MLPPNRLQQHRKRQQHADAPALKAEDMLEHYLNIGLVSTVLEVHYRTNLSKGVPVPVGVKLIIEN